MYEKDNSSKSASGHYFHQDLLVANFIYKNQPFRHIDVGSRVDGFISHVACFRNIEVIDIRESDDSGHENISFIKADIMDVSCAERFKGITDSLSCLHALEHFGLVRYGDTLNPNGHLLGLSNLIGMISAGGKLYISFPISSQPRTVFNAHRIFSPQDIWDGQ